MNGGESTLAVVGRLGRAQFGQTVLFGALLGTRDGLDWDPELLFVAAVLHDLGFTEFISGQGPFEQRGAAAADSWLSSQGWRAERAAIVGKTVEEVIDAYPRQGFKQFFADTVRSEARSQPRSATAALCRWGQLTWRIKRSPFPE